MKETVAVFDLDGTLVDSSRDIHASLHVALAEVDDGRIDPAADEAAVYGAGGGCHGLSLETFWARARPAGTPAGRAAFVAAYRRHYGVHLLSHTRPFPGVAEGLFSLLGAGPGRGLALRLAVATTKRTATAERVLDGLGLRAYFDVVLGSDGLPPKPDPAVILAVFLALGYTGGAPWPGPGLMVGDTEHDIAAGRAAGLRTCAVGWSELPKERLVGADHHAGTFAEVVDLVLRIATPRTGATTAESR